MDRLNRELERALRTVRGLQAVPLNREQATRECGFDCIDELREGGYVEYADGREGEHMYGEYNRVQLTVKGRNYWSERRRDWLHDARNWAFGVAGVVLGAVLSELARALVT